MQDALQTKPSTDASNDGNFMPQSILVFDHPDIFTCSSQYDLWGEKNEGVLSFFNIFLPAVYPCPTHIYIKFFLQILRVFITKITDIISAYRYDL
jgi:hypothetical protein